MDFAGLRVRKLALPIKHHIKKPSRSKKNLKTWNVGFFSHNSSNLFFLQKGRINSSFIKPVVYLLVVSLSKAHSSSSQRMYFVQWRNVEHPFDIVVLSFFTYAVLISADIDASFTPLCWCDEEKTPNVSKREQTSDVSGWVSGSRPVSYRDNVRSLVPSHMFCLVSFPAPDCCITYLVSFSYPYTTFTQNSGGWPTHSALLFTLVGYSSLLYVQLKIKQ